MRRVSLRGALRAPTPALRFSSPQKSPPPGTACRSTTGGGSRGEPPLPAAKGCPGGARRACEAPRSAGSMARARSALRRLTWRILSERSERSERSELCAGPWTRAPQGSRSEATAASAARRAPPGQPFAATATHTPKRTANVRNGPSAVYVCSPTSDFLGHADSAPAGTPSAIGPARRSESHSPACSAAGRSAVRPACGGGGRASS